MWNSFWRRNRSVKLELCGEGAPVFVLLTTNYGYLFAHHYCCIAYTMQYNTRLALKVSASGAFCILHHRRCFQCPILINKSSIENLQLCSSTRVQYESSAHIGVGRLAQCTSLLYYIYTLCNLSSRTFRLELLIALLQIVEGRVIVDDVVARVVVILVLRRP